MNSQLIALSVVSLIVAVDNALLAGMILPWAPGSQKPVIVTAAGILLGMTQIGMAIGVGHLMAHASFRIGAGIVLIWMCARTLSMVPASHRGCSLWGHVWRVYFFTLFGNLDNMIWLGSELKGNDLWLVFFSLATIPLFIVVAVFLAEQCERHRWILVVGAGMMAWAASGLFVPRSVWPVTVWGVVFPLERVVIALSILGVGFVWRWWTVVRGA
ncbi:hypothetical protein [Alicyclobacillus sp.]|uniref:hypothetical protein n=1 Tax=Alicyclobacillus sp. TaxID=61169 RepID=UPI0025BF55D8|nr:hypothetical protein [Alicyclobacillus sp.]MCL6516035.1 hypothetical protein [Alicyclobacillus sp.]